MLMDDPFTVRPLLCIGQGLRHRACGEFRRRNSGSAVGRLSSTTRGMDTKVRCHPDRSRQGLAVP